jgi:hypothetical protein
VAAEVIGQPRQRIGKTGVSVHRGDDGMQPGAKKPAAAALFQPIPLVCIAKIAGRARFLLQ